MFKELQLILQSIGTYLSSIFGTSEDYAYLGVALVATCAYVLARLIASYLPDLLNKLAQHLDIKLQPDTVDLFRFPLFYLTFLGGLFFAVHIATISPAVILALKAILKSMMITVVGLFVYRLIKIFLEHTAHNGGRGLIQLKTLPLFTNAAMFFVLIATAHQVFAVWDIDMTAVLASAGIAGIAIGMAAKDMLADVIAGVLILTDNPYNVGDIIQLDSGENKVKGRVIRIGMRSTRILTEYNVEVIMPNAKMANSRILNESSSPRKMGVVTMEIKTASNVNPKHMRNLFLEIILSHPEILKDEELEVLILDFDDRTVTWELVFCTPEADWEELIACAIREAAYQRMLDEGIQFALPTEHDLAMLKMVDSKQEIAITQLPDSRQDVHIKEMPNEARTLHVKEIPSLFGNGQVKIENPQESLQRQRHTEPYRGIASTPTQTAKAGNTTPGSPPRAFRPARPATIKTQLKPETGVPTDKGAGQS